LCPVALEKSTLSYLPEEFLVGTGAILLVDKLIESKPLFPVTGTGTEGFGFQSVIITSHVFVTVFGPRHSLPHARISPVCLILPTV
jgi:hypothetical protein